MKAPRFWSADAGHDSRMARLLTPLGWAYAAAGQLRRAVVTPERLGIPVICVGNVTAGGAGKTPVCLALADRLRAAGHTVHFLSRGYRGRTTGPHRVDLGRDGAAAVGDEPLLLARMAPTWVARRRPDGGRAAEAAGAGVLILDDGFQNPSLIQDLSILVVDGGAGFGNGRLIPAGPLRETLATALSRAHAVILLGMDRTETCGTLICHAEKSMPVLTARLQPDAAAAARLTGVRVIAFAGIGRPEKFFETCRAIGARIIEAHPFPDHHPYGPDEIMRLVERAAFAQAQLVTTEKDAVRLPAEAVAMVETVGVRVVWDDPNAVDDLLNRFLSSTKGGRIGRV